MLEYTFPLSDRAVQRYIGLPVEVTMQDGARYSGILTSCYNGLIGLNGGEIGDEEQNAFIMNYAPAAKQGKKAAEEANVKGGADKKEKKKKKRSNRGAVAATQSFPFDPSDYESVLAPGQNDNNTSGLCIGCSDGIPTDAVQRANRSPNRSRRRDPYRYGPGRFGPAGPYRPFRSPVTLEMEDIAFLLVIP